MDRSNKIVIGLMLAVVIGSVGPTYGSPLQNSNCKLTDVKPLPNEGPNKYVVDTVDQTTMATFSGYLKYNVSTEQYLPLTIEGVSFGDGNLLLTLQTDCAEIELTPKEVVVKLAVPVEGDDYCSFHSVAETGGVFTHFHCPYEYSYPCVTKSGKVLQFVTYEVSYEYNGDPAAHKVGKYSRVCAWCPEPEN